MATPLTQAKDAGIKTLFPTGFTGTPAMVAGFKQIGWSPTIVGWGGLNDFGVTAAQVPGDGRRQSLSAGRCGSRAMVCNPSNAAIPQGMTIMCRLWQ